MARSGILGNNALFAGADRGLAAALRVLERIAAALDAHLVDGTARQIELADLDAAALRIIDDALGEGEVVIDLTDGERTRIVEATMAGVWRLHPAARDHEALPGCVEVAGFPGRARAALERSTRTDFAIELDEVYVFGTMNAMPVLAEVRDHAERYRPGCPGTAVNIGRLSMSPTDENLINRALGDGPVQATCRGYGISRAASTGCRNVWRVRHFNADERMLANVIEIVDVPEIVAAPEEDIRDGVNALADAIAAYAP